MGVVKYHEGRFPPRELDWQRLLPLIGPANAAVARYDGVLHGIPNAQVLLSPLTVQEAVLSSKIEGTQATIGEVLEFEAIHPFLDGNGRTGRLLVPLFMVDQKLLGSPDFYISAYLEARREEYYERLLAVSRDGDWTGWCAFFLKALTKQAGDNELKAKAVLDLYGQKKDWITELTRSQHAIRALDWFFSRPVFKTSDFVRSAQIPKPTANRIVRLARDDGLLRELRAGSGRRPAILVFPDLLNIVEGRPVF